MIEYLTNIAEFDKYVTILDTHPGVLYRAGHAEAGAVHPLGGGVWVTKGSA